METLIESIRTAVAADATDEMKAAGASACRNILAALEAKAGEPLAAPAPGGTNPFASAVALLRGMPPDQLLDLAIARLRLALPPGVAMPAVEPAKFHLVAVPPVATRK